MRNVFSSRLKVHRKFDLKGSTVDRQASTKEKVCLDTPSFKAREQFHLIVDIKIHVRVYNMKQEGQLTYVFIRIVAVTTINFIHSSVQLLIKGGCCSRATTIHFAHAHSCCDSLREHARVPDIRRVMHILLIYCSRRYYSRAALIFCVQATCICSWSEIH